MFKTNFSPISNVLKYLLSGNYILQRRRKKDLSVDLFFIDENVSLHEEEKNSPNWNCLHSFKCWLLSNTHTRTHQYVWTFSIQLYSVLICCSTVYWSWNIQIIIYSSNQCVCARARFNHIRNHSFCVIMYGIWIGKLKLSILKLVSSNFCKFIYELHALLDDS